MLQPRVAFAPRPLMLGLAGAEAEGAVATRLSKIGLLEASGWKHSDRLHPFSLAAASIRYA